MPKSTPPSTRGNAEADFGELSVCGQLEGLARAGQDALVAVVSEVQLPARGPVRGWLLDEEGAQRVEGARVLNGAMGDERIVVVLRSIRSGETLRGAVRLVLETENSPYLLEDARDEPHQEDLATLGARCFGAVPEAPAEITAELATRGLLMPDVAAQLQALRDIVVPSYPPSVIEPSAIAAAHVDCLWRIDESAYYLEGWLLDRADRMTALRIVSPEGETVELLDRAFRYPRPDVATVFRLPATARLGFICHVELRGASVLPSGWVLQYVNADGTGRQVDVPPVADDPGALRSTILGDFQLGASDGDSLRSDHIRPALERLEQRLAGHVAIDTIDQHGEPPEDPQVSVIVPLYQRTEFLEHQIAQFVHDPELRAADLIYVLDSPEDAVHLRPFAAHLYDLYRVPFRLVTLTANGGYSVVNNLGASVARGRLLLLLNSDVLPAAPGWLSRLIEFYDAQPNVGAVAPKLLYEDDSIQHAGLYFDRPPGASVWSNEHYYKGLHRSFPAANVARPVPAVTGACLLIDADLYRDLDGLNGGYIRGDYEDTDLCLRLRKQGRETWYVPVVELYHLEGQSYPSAERALISEYNKWLHTESWSSVLAEADGQDGVTL